MNTFHYDGLVIHSCGITACLPDWTWDTGKYPSSDYDLWTVLKGDGSLTAAGLCRPVSIGSCFLLRPGERYVGAQNPENRLTVLHIHFDFLREGRPVQFTPEEGFPLGRLLYDFDFVQKILYKVLDASSAGGTLEAVHWLQAALDEIARQDRQSPQPNPLLREIAGLCARIQQNPGENWRLSQLADELGYSADYFGHLFRQAAGSPLSLYVIGARINQAKLLLSSSDEQIGEIGFRLGYRDACFFSKQFRQWTGLSPMAYRKAAFSAGKSGEKA